MPLAVLLRTPDSSPATTAVRPTYAPCAVAVAVAAWRVARSCQHRRRRARHRRRGELCVKIPPGGVRMPRATIKRCTVHVLEVLLLRDLGCTACAVRATAMPSAAAATIASQVSQFARTSTKRGRQGRFNTHRSCCRSCCSVASHAHTMSLFSSFRATARWVVLECTSGAEMVRISFRRSFSTRAAAPFDVPRAAFDFDRDTERPPRALDREVDLC